MMQVIAVEMSPPSGPRMIYDVSITDEESGKPTKQFAIRTFDTPEQARLKIDLIRWFIHSFLVKHPWPFRNATIADEVSCTVARSVIEGKVKCGGCGRDMNPVQEECLYCKWENIMYTEGFL